MSNKNDEITCSVNNGGSSGNSTTVPLNAGQLFVGNAETTQVFNCISVTLTCETTATVTIQQSLDRVNWDVSEIFAYTPGGTTDMTFIQDIVLPFYRVIEKNTSGTTMGFNRLTTILFSTQKDVRITDVLGAVTVVQPNAALLQATVTGSLTSVGTITNPVTVSSITNPVTVSSITNPVTVSSVTNPVTVSSVTNPVTVNGTLTSVDTITNPVTVSSVTNPVTVTGTLTSVDSITNPVTVSSVTNPVTVSSIMNPVTVNGSLSSVGSITTPIVVNYIGSTVIVEGVLGGTSVAVNGTVAVVDNFSNTMSATRGTATNSVLSIQRSIDIRTPVTLYATAAVAGLTGVETLISLTKSLSNTAATTSGTFLPLHQARSCASNQSSLRPWVMP